MPLPEKGEHTNNFNMQTDSFTKRLTDKISSYDLNKDEKAKIQELVTNRAEKLTELKQELDKGLKNNQDKLQLNYNPPNSGRTREQTQANNLQELHKNYNSGLRNTEKDFNQNLDKVLDKAEQDGRGPRPNNPDHPHDRSDDHDRR